MTRTMYDAVTAANIPANAQMVAGYVDRIVLAPWTAADWARFPNAVKVTIVKKASTNGGHVLDVEKGDATPAEAPGWVRMRRTAGADPTVYCDTSTWPAVRAAFRSAGVAEPHYWVARYDGDPTIPAGAVAKQYKNTPGYDVSSVVDHWPGVDAASPTDWTDMATQQDFEQAVLAALQTVFYSDRYTDGRNFADESVQQTGTLLAMQAQLNQVIIGLTAITEALSKFAPGTPGAAGPSAAEIASAVADEEAKRLQS